MYNPSRAMKRDRLLREQVVQVNHNTKGEKKEVREDRNSLRAGRTEIDDRKKKIIGIKVLRSSSKKDYDKETRARGRIQTDDFRKCSDPKQKLRKKKK